MIKEERMKYTIVIASSDIALTEKVNDYIREGWEPLGGYQRHAGYSGQAMIKEKVIYRIEEDRNG